VAERKNKALQALLVGTAAAVLAAAFWLPGALESFEARTWDLRERLFAAPGPATPKVVTILLDQESLVWAKKENGWGWPWPREVYSAIVDFCKRGGAKALVFDVLLTEPSAYGVSDDKALGDSASSYGKVIGAMLLGSHMATETSWPQGFPPPRLEITGAESWAAAQRPRGFDFPLAEFPIPELGAAAASLANTNLPADSVDGVYRREPLFSRFGGKLVPSEALAAYLVGEAGPHRLTVSKGLLDVDGHRVPLDRDGRALLRFRGPSLTHKAYRAAAVIRSEQLLLGGEKAEIDPAALKDAYVFFGFTASGLFDLKPTPMSGAYPGVEVNATMLDNLLSSDFVRPIPPWASLLIALALSLLAALAVTVSSRVLGNVAAYVILIPAAPALAIGAFAAGWSLPLVFPELGVLLSLVGSSLLNYATEGRQKRYLKGAFKQYLSPAVIEQLIAHPERLKLGGERRELTIFFSDVQGFTSISEVLSPEDLTSLLNDYLSAMCDIIQEEGGTIDKYEGDAIIAFWNAPIDLPDHAVRGLRASLRCQAALAELRPAFKARVGKDLYVRVGMNSGPAIVGNMGSRNRFDYTMLGDAVNLAARLEGVNKQFGTYTMVSAATLQLAGDAFPARELSRIAVVGRKEPVTVFEPMFPEQFAARQPVLEVFGRALGLYYEGFFDGALALFESISASDPPAARYADRCRELLASPPPSPWEGVWVMTSK
jgi:adenylate cyclase